MPLAALRLFLALWALAGHGTSWRVSAGAVPITDLYGAVTPW